MGELNQSTQPSTNLHWRDLLAKLKYDASFEGWRAYHALAAKYEVSETAWLSMYAPTVIHRTLFSANLLACLQEPDEHVDAALAEIAQAARELRFGREAAKRGRRDSHVQALHRRSTDQLRQMMPGLADLFLTMFRCYRADTSPVLEDVDDIMRQVREDESARQREQALAHIGPAGSQILRGAQLWDGWCDEGTPEFRYWALSLRTLAESGQIRGLVPLGTIAVERAQLDMRMRQVVASLTPKDNTDSETQVPDLDRDMAAMERVMSDLDDLESRSEPLSDEEIGAMGADRYTHLGESALHVANLGTNNLRYQMDDDDESRESSKPIELMSDLSDTAIAALGMLRYRVPEVIRTLIHCVTDSPEGFYLEVTDSAIWALQQMGDEAVAAARRVVTYSSNLRACDDCLRIMGGAGRGKPAVFDELAARFASTSWLEGRARYAVPIALTHDARARDVLIPRLGDPDLDSDDAAQLLEALATLKVPYTVDKETRDVTIDGYGTFEGIAPILEDEELGEEWENIEPVYDEQGIPHCEACGGELEWVDGHWEHVDEDELIDGLDDEVIYDEKGVPRDSITGEELHYIGGRWQQLPPAKAADAPGSSQAPLRFDHVGRNDPCPCGSGKKFKYCHGR